MPLLIRPMTPDEYPLLKDFLYEAVFQKHGPPLPRNIIQQPSLRIYTEDFGRRHGDLCLCADTGDLIVGAAWVRYMHGFGNVADDMPELAMAVHPPYRGQGLGTALLHAVIGLLLDTDAAGISLSVQKENPAAALYRRTGFTVVRENDEEYVMVYRFRRTSELRFSPFRHEFL